MGKKTKSNYSGSTRMSVLGVFVVGACAGTSLHNVGDVNGSGGLADQSSGGAGAVSKGGANAAGKSPATGGKAAVGGNGGTAPNKGGTGAVGTAGHEGILLGGQPPTVDDGGAGGAYFGAIDCEACELVATTPDIRGVWAGRTAVYWIEHGGFDALGNYLDDGRLLSLPFGEEMPTVVTSSLQGPIQLRVTDDYAYVILDRSSAPGAGAVELARVALDNGDTEVLQALPSAFTDSAFTTVTDWFHRHFAVSGGEAFWENGGALFRLAESSAGPPQSFHGAPGLATLLADDSFLYLQDAHGISALPLPAAGAATPVWVSEASGNFLPLILAGSSFFALEAGYVARLPKAGGAFKRLLATPAPWGNRFVTNGTSYVGDFGHIDSASGIPAGALIEGKISDSLATRTLATAALRAQQLPWEVWDATATTVYIGYYDELYRVARQF